MTSPHQDADGLISRLRECARDCARMEDLHDAEFFNNTANLIEQQARALGEAEAERDKFAEILASPLADKVVEYGDLALAAEARLAEAMKVIELFANGSIDIAGAAIIIGYPAAKPALAAARSFLNSASNKEG